MLTECRRVVTRSNKTDEIVRALITLVRTFINSRP